jgi:hypothetical protein
VCYVAVFPHGSRDFVPAPPITPCNGRLGADSLALISTPGLAAGLHSTFVVGLSVRRTQSRMLAVTALAALAAAAGVSAAPGLSLKVTGMPARVARPGCG